jgi:septal ring factor EnvC (AmiA/AmiB activator)
MMLSESVWIAIIQWCVGPVAVIILGAFLNKSIKKTRSEITNSHSVHLRDDLDGKFKLVFAKLDTLRQEQQEIDKKLDAHAEDHNQIFGELADHEARLSGQAAKMRRNFKK